MNDDQTILDDLCRRAAELIGTTRGPLKSVRVKVGDMSVEVEWPDVGAGIDKLNGVNGVNGVGVAEGPVPAAPAQDDGAFAVNAPLVGTFYRAPAPGARPFVEVDDEVEEGQQVAIVEAMKLMNAVTAERAGRVIEVLADDATPVEYGQPLFVLAAPDPD
jgi:acetyl-CoA carboxylase biotin carboxyl carrier protein